MKKLLRIIFLILLIHYAFGECGFDSDKKVCTGSPTNEKKVCLPNSAGNGCTEGETCASKVPGESGTLTFGDCQDLPVYNEKKEKLEDYACGPASDGKSCKGKGPACPEGKAPDEGKTCSYYSASEDTKACINDKDNEGQCKVEDLCNSVKKDSTGKTTIDCSKYPVENSETHTCVENSEEGDNACKEEAKSNNNAPTTTVKVTQTVSGVVSTNIANIATTSLTKNQTLSEIVSTIISTTIAKGIESTSIITTTSITETNQTTNSSGETSIVFLGCSQFQMASSYFTFNIHFIPVANSLFSDTLTFVLNIIYNTYLRRLEDVNANCNIDSSSSASMINYLCRVQAETANIKQIKFETNFKFSQGNVKIAGTSPLGKMSMNNLQNIDDKYSKLLASNPSIYILDDSSFYGYGNKKFNISGTISGKKPTSISVNKDLTLMMNLQNNVNEEEITKEADCTVTDIKTDKYTLDCTAKEKNKYNLQSAMSIVDNDILLVNIKDSDEGGAVLDPNTEDDVQNFRYPKKSGGIGAGAIVGIVLACVVALAAVITAILCLKKSPNHTISNESEVVVIKKN